MRAILTTKISCMRRDIISNILRVALIWAGVGTSVAAVICFPVIEFYAIFVIVDAAPGASLRLYFFASSGIAWTIKKSDL
jgi:hypothetical protein